jgi:hypothetical protein
MIDSILTAMKADCVPVGVSGLWCVKKARINEPITHWEFAARNSFNDSYTCDPPPPGKYTYLLRWTEATLHKSYGELVMNDFPGELKKHLQFIMVARGRVLVTGLGLGCVVRGLLARGRVDSIDVIERDADVLKLCAASVEHPKVTIHHADAREWEPDGKYDFAWHDLWSDPDKDEPNLHVTHMELMARFIKKIPRQGAWAMPRKYFRRLPELRLRKPQ